MAKHNHNEQEEVRSFKIDFRAAKDSRRVEGYAALFEEVTDMGWYEEVISRGAFDEAELSGVRALFNHNPDHLLASTASGTLKLEIDERGLKYSFEMPDTTLGNDLIEMIRRGDLRQSSFAFRIKKQTWTETEGKPDRRTIEQIEIVYDVAPVTYPAYENTEVALRSKNAEPRSKSEEQSQDQPPLFSESFADDVAFFTQRLRAV